DPTEAAVLSPFVEQPPHRSAEGVLDPLVDERGAGRPTEVELQGTAGRGERLEHAEVGDDGRPQPRGGRAFGAHRLVDRSADLVEDLAEQEGEDVLLALE